MCDGAGCAPQVVVCLSEELLSQAVMMVERCRPTLTINMGGARQHWLEGMLRHEIGASPVDWHKIHYKYISILVPSCPRKVGACSLPEPEL